MAHRYRQGEGIPHVLCLIGHVQLAQVLEVRPGMAVLHPEPVRVRIMRHNGADRSADREPDQDGMGLASAEPTPKCL